MIIETERNFYYDFFLCKRERKNDDFKSVVIENNNSATRRKIKGIDPFLIIPTPTSGAERMDAMKWITGLIPKFKYQSNRQMIETAISMFDCSFIKTKKPFDEKLNEFFSKNVDIIPPKFAEFIYVSGALDYLEMPPKIQFEVLTKIFGRTGLFFSDNVNVNKHFKAVISFPFTFTFMFLEGRYCFISTTGEENEIVPVNWKTYKKFLIEDCSS